MSQENITNIHIDFVYDASPQCEIIPWRTIVNNYGRYRLIISY